jgi:hypothetical protein
VRAGGGGGCGRGGAGGGGGGGVGVGGRGIDASTRNRILAVCAILVDDVYGTNDDDNTFTFICDNNNEASNVQTL